jgi:hypothetical protein
MKQFAKRFNLGQICRKSNAEKQKGIPALRLILFVVETLFSRETMHHEFQRNKERLGFSENTVRNLLNSQKVHWEKLILLLAKQIVSYFLPLTSENRENVFIIDDSMFERKNGKKVELSALQFDHANGCYNRGFRFLQLAWSDGVSLVPLAFRLMSGNRERVEASSLDKRSWAWKRRVSATQKATETTLELIQDALNHGITASYVLFDSWFSSPKMFVALRRLAKPLHAIAVVKKTEKTYYWFQGKQMDVKQIYNAHKKRRGRSHYLLEVTVEAESEGVKIPVKLVYVRNQNKKSDYLVLGTTDVSLTAEEIIAIYGKRWAIEVYFKICKQYLHLAEYQGLSYDGLVAHTSLMTVAYLLLCVEHRENADDRTIGDLFFYMVEELADIDFLEAVELLVSLFEQAFEEVAVITQDKVEEILEAFMSHLPGHLSKKLMMA